MDSLVKYELRSATDAPFLISLAVKFVLVLSVFLGFVGQLGFCSISWKETKSVFQLLPVGDRCELDGRQQWQKKYFSTILAILVAFSAVFVALDLVAKVERESKEATWIDSSLDEMTRLVVTLPDLPEYAIKLQTEQEIYSAYRQDVDEVAARYEERLTGLIGGYYDDCVANVETYLKWCSGPGGMAARLLGPIGEKMAEASFNGKVVELVDEEEIASVYGEYVRELHGLYEEYYNAIREIEQNLPPLPESSEDEMVSLFVQRVLLPQGSEFRTSLGTLLGDDLGEVRSGIVGIIEERREEVISELGETKDALIWEASFSS